MERLREPLLFAPRELTGKDGGNESAKWLALLGPKEKEPEKPGEEPARAAPGESKNEPDPIP